ncbi:MAG: hypothetical protein M1837_000992 [Sclerophora amabilis]|nr:MAG: hypothetical protein M1837_000992 [Sclerophora amabilis]
MPILYPRPTSIFDPPTLFDDFLSSPLRFLIYHLHAFLLLLRGPAYTPSPHHRNPPLRIVCLSDTHCQIPTQPIPDGDVLIHAGDLTNAGTVAEVQSQINWLNSLPHREKIVVCGNHDSVLDPQSRRPEHFSDDDDDDANGSAEDSRLPDWGPIHYLERRGITLSFPHHANRQLHIYGAPQIPRCGGPDFAFQYDGDDTDEAEQEWSGEIPMETDILVTHTPPRFHLDLPAALGCDALLKEVWRVRPTLHVFGHVHSGHGKEHVWWDEAQMAYERVCRRRRKKRRAAGAGSSGGIIATVWRNILGVVRTFVTDAVDIPGWTDGFRIVWYGVTGVLWSRVWGGAGNRGGLMINAALSYQSTGKLGNPVQVVEI